MKAKHPPSRYRGTFNTEEKRAQLELAINCTRMTELNRSIVRSFLIDGKRLSSLDCSKQQAYARVVRIIMLWEQIFDK